MLTILLLIAMAAFFAATVLWLVKPRSAALRNAQKIRESVARLLKRPFGAYVIIEDPVFGKYVQISGSVREPLVFDLPRQLLTLDEFERACQLFGQLGHAGPETFEVYDSANGRAAGTQTSFILSFGDDVERATELALKVFAGVYAVGDNVALIITEQ